MNAQNPLKVVSNEPQEKDYRVLPHNQEAEQGLLGALLNDNAALDQIGDVLTADHFFFPAHAKIFEAINALYDRGEIANYVAIKRYFEKNAELAPVEGEKYIQSIQDNFAFIFNVPNYAQTIYELHLARELIRNCRLTVDQAHDHSYDQTIQDVIEDHESTLFALAESGVSKNDVVSFDTSIFEAIKMAELAYNAGGGVSGVPTGLNDLDQKLGGLHKTDLLILAGRPSMGKTALATNLAVNAALKYMETNGDQGARVGFFSLEMGHSQIASRILGGHAGVSSDAIRKGDIQKNDLQRFINKSHELAKLPLFIDDTTQLTISALRTRARRMKRKYDIGLLVVDYLQLLQGSKSHNENRTQEIAEITRGLKGIAKDLDIPVLALSQLSRSLESREDKRPMLSDLRDLGAIEQDADIVMFVYREEYYLSRSEPEQKLTEDAEKYSSRQLQWQERMDATRNITELNIAKQRHGEIGTVKLFFDAHYTKFTDLERNC